MDRITGWQDLQDGLCWAKLGVKNGQDGRITGFTGQRAVAQLGAVWTGLQDLGGSGKYHVR